MSQPFNIDSRSVLIDKLGIDSDRFETSNLYFKNNKGLFAVFEIWKLRSEFLDFAKDSKIDQNQFGDRRPPQPEQGKLTDEEYALELDNYRELLKQWELGRMASKMQVPVPDMFAIEQYLEPYLKTIHATPAVGGRRFRAFTRDPLEEQKGLFGMGKAKQVT